MKYLDNYSDFINESFEPQKFGGGVFGWIKGKIDQKKKERLKQELQLALKQGTTQEKDNARRRLEDYEAESKIQTIIPKLEQARIEAQNYYYEWLKKPDTKSKFKNPKNINEIIKLVKNIKIILDKFSYDGTGGVLAFVMPPFAKDDISNALIIKKYTCLDIRKLSELSRMAKEKNKGFLWESWENVYFNYNFDRLQRNTPESIKSTIIHEIGHLIDYKLSQLGEKSMGDFFRDKFVDTEDQSKDKGTRYIERGTENYARLQSMREFLGLEPIETTDSIVNKILDKLKSDVIKISTTGKLIRASKDSFGESEVDMVLPWKMVSKFITNDNKSITIKKGRLYNDDLEFLGYKLGATSATIFNFDENQSKKEILNEFDLKDDSSSPREPIDWAYLLVNYSKVVEDTLVINIEEISNLNNQLVKTNQKDSVASKTV